MISFLRVACLPLTLGLGSGLMVFTHYEDPNAVKLGEQERLAADLDQRRASSNARILAKSQLINDLIDGRRTLPGVTDQFIELNRQPPEIASCSHLFFEGATERERTARQVVGHARTELRLRSDLSAEQQTHILERLESELRDLYE